VVIRVREFAMKVNVHHAVRRWIYPAAAAELRRSQCAIKEWRRSLNVLGFVAPRSTAEGMNAVIDAVQARRKQAKDKLRKESIAL